MTFPFPSNKNWRKGPSRLGIRVKIDDIEPKKRRLLKKRIQYSEQDTALNCSASLHFIARHYRKMPYRFGYRVKINDIEPTHRLYWLRPFIDAMESINFSWLFYEPSFPHYQTVSQEALST